MAALHFHQQRQTRRRLAHRSNRRVARSRRDAQEPSGLVNGMTLTGIGLALLAGGTAAEVEDAAFFGFVLFFFSSPFLVFGGMLLFILLVESVYRRLRRIQHHCGRCRFYQALEGQYALGRCRSDPRQRVTQRTSTCPFFEYSERAMVRDRFAQHAEALARPRGKHRIGSTI